MGKNISMKLAQILSQCQDLKGIIGIDRYNDLAKTGSIEIPTEELDLSDRGYSRTLEDMGFSIGLSSDYKTQYLYCY